MIKEAILINGCYIFAIICIYVMSKITPSKLAAFIYAIYAILISIAFSACIVLILL